MRPFLEKWLLPYCIAISIPYLVALHRFSPATMPAAALVPMTASLLTIALLLWPRKPKRDATPEYEDQHAGRSVFRPARPSKTAPKRLTPHFICGLYERFQEKDADKIIEPHKNKSMTVAGRVVYFSDRYLYLENKSLWHIDRIRVYLDFAKPDPVTALLMRKTVKVRGQLTSAWHYDITLMDAELLKAPNL